MGLDQDLEREARKRAIFEAMSPRGKKYIKNKVGYEQWDPFQEPKDPIDIRRDETKRTAKMLFREFLHSRRSDEYSNAYGRGILDMAMGIVNNDERCMAMYEFSIWYKELLEKDKADQ